MLLLDVFQKKIYEESGGMFSFCRPWRGEEEEEIEAQLAKRLHDLPVESGQELRKISFKDQSCLGQSLSRPDSGMPGCPLSIQGHQYAIPASVREDLAQPSANE
ncbi:hypothetical protein DMENIID0001_114840 [Sergentomyia squamirostris]